MSSTTPRKLEPNEISHLSQLQRKVMELVHSVGQTEVRKQRLLSEIAAAEEEAQGVMQAAAARLGIPEGVPWQMAPDGSVYEIDPATGAPADPPKPLVTL